MRMIAFCRSQCLSTRAVLFTQNLNEDELSAGQGSIGSPLLIILPLPLYIRFVEQRSTLGVT